MTSTCGFTRGEAYAVPCKVTDVACNGRCWLHCSYGLAMEERLQALYSGNSPKWKIDEQFEKLWNQWEDHSVKVHHMPDNRIKKYPNGKYKGPFAFTLTMSPSDGLSEDEMMHACRKIMEQQSQPVKKFAWYLEYKDEDTKHHPHIHGMYETENGTRIERRTWMRHWKIWDEKTKLGAGFRGGYHRPVRSDEAYSQYIVKGYAFGDSNL